MREDFLHYVWKHKKVQLTDLKTCEGEVLSVKSVGQHNYNSGPDFFNAQLIINDQLWAGNVEIHLKSSDWYVHRHEKDHFYDNVILHVVWEHDTEVYRKDNSIIPTLELKQFINEDLIKNYHKLFSKEKKWINCESDFSAVDDFLINNWVERLYIERLEQKSTFIENQLVLNKNNWEATLFVMLAKNFGLKVNEAAFYSLAQSIDYSVLRKVSTDLFQIEALFFGQSGLLNAEVEDVYYKQLQNEYNYLKQKFKLESSSVLLMKFFRLRPANFPTIRLAQLASLYHTYTNLFSELIHLETIESFYELLKIKTSEYWDSHYNFGKTSKKTKKYLSKPFIDLLLINTIIPLKFRYAKSQGNTVEKEIIDLISSIAPEKNNLLTKFESIKAVNTSALHSQGIIQLKTKYCDDHKCLKCAIGNSLLKA